MTALTLIFAHLGHWYVSLPVYLAPIVLIVAWLKLTEWRQGRRRQRSEDGRDREDPNERQGG